MKVVGNSCNHGFDIGEIVKITDVTGDRYDAYDLDGKTSWYVCDEDLELVEEQTQTVGDHMKNLFNEIIKVIKDNPEVTQQLSKSFQKIQDENEDLKIENKNLQAKIDYLRGQISVYERFLKEEN